MVLERHISTHITEKPFNCAKCGKRFAHEYTLKIHEVHIYIRTCKLMQIILYLAKNETNLLHSQYSFLQATHLEKSARKIFNYHICPETFVAKPNLQNHIETCHEDQKNYRCPVCDRKFGLPSNLKRHVKARHAVNKDKIHACAQCEYKSHVKANLAEHVRRHDIANGPECYFCQKKFPRYSELVNHFRRHTLEM